MAKKKAIAKDGPKMEAMPAMPMPDDKWQAEDDMRTMVRAEEIKADPERVKRMHTHAKKHAKAIRSIEDLKDAYDLKYGYHPENDKPSSKS